MDLQISNIYIGLFTLTTKGDVFIFSIPLKAQFTVKMLLISLPYFAKMATQTQVTWEVIACKTNGASLKWLLPACKSSGT